MADLEKSIKKSFEKQRSLFKKTTSCPSELELGKYLDNTLAPVQRERIEKHLADCGYCLDLLVVAKEAIRDLKQKVTIGQYLARQKWFILSMCSFVLSFLIKRYFFQFLTLSLIFGIKWALSAEGSKNLVMIFRGLSHHQGSEDEEQAKRVFLKK